ncbi:outer membrane beta-barrel protein [Labilibacter marinus]|uniref:outer membrane beta-barrel protein n=1 Tax=Labilibacter marinus TaxID=1477105 RepID=UPI00082B5D22|nr:outer membrane beta-barrel protein [Labilibacter marinus]
MKKILLILVVALATVATSFAQSTDYKPFKVDVGALYAIPGGEAVSAGAGFYLEPKYNVTNNIAVGLKMEWAIMGASSDYDNVSISAVGSYQLTGDYYFSENKVRPFAGLGIGIYSLGSVETDVVSAAAGEDPFAYDFGSKFGFAPRVGLLMGHFRAALEYNVITGIDTGISELDNKNYLSIKLGFEIGGGKN